MGTETVSAHHHGDPAGGDCQWRQPRWCRCWPLLLSLGLSLPAAADRVDLDDGRSLTGLLAVDGADAITILQPEAKQITVPRGEIADLRMLSTSLMPEGLEQLLTPAQLRSVIAFIQAR